MDLPAPGNFSSNEPHQMFAGLGFGFGLRVFVLSSSLCKGKRALSHSLRLYSGVRKMETQRHEINSTP
uniref:Uncharacterized protein n=1 Tax=Caenorhabditis japonica TaxID=281687 RepID=A0A8R1E8X1_CAEJA